MSYLKTKRVQLGDNVTASNNFVLRQPDTADGTMRISNGIVGAETDLVTVTSAGNVGIGTSSPITNLHVGSGVTGNGLGLLISRGATTNFLVCNDGTKEAYIGADPTQAYVKLGSLTNHPVSISQNNGTAIYIDTSKRVTMPYQPHAQVYKNNGGNDTVAGGTTVVWNVVSSNIGNIYNVANGRFTVPVAGRYMVATVVMTGSTNKYGIYNVRRNGNLSFPDGWVQGYNYGTANDKALTFSGVVDLDANDYLDVYVSSSNNSLYWGGYNYMTVTLVG